MINVQLSARVGQRDPATEGEFARDKHGAPENAFVLLLLSQER